MRKDLIILGTGGGAHDVLDLVETVPAEWRVIGFLDDAKLSGEEHAGLPVLGRLGDAARFAGCFINTVGSDRSYRQRPRIMASTGLNSDRFATLVHAGAFVSPRATVGRGTCVSQGASIAGGVVIGDHVCVGPGAVIGHDATVGDYAIVAPGAIVSGFVRLNSGCYIGAGAVVRQRVEVGTEALVGLGAVVLEDVPPRTTVIGNPARVLRRDPGSPQPLRRDDGRPSLTRKFRAAEDCRERPGVIAVPPSTTSRRLSEHDDG